MTPAPPTTRNPMMNTMHQPAARRAALTFIAAIAAAAFATVVPPAQAATYADIFEGSFGSMSYASVAGGGMQVNGGTLQFFSSQTVEDYNSTNQVYFHGESSSSLFDGTMRASTLAGSCGAICSWPLGYRSVGSGTALWEHVTFEEAPSMMMVPMKLHIDGVQDGLAYAQIRWYVGYSDPFTKWNTMPGQGWQIVGTSGATDIDTTVNLGDILVFSTSSLGIYVEMTTYAQSIATETSFAEFGHTARFSWDLPAGVHVVSSSGQFLAAPVPEPGAWALMAAGLAAVGGVARRRRRR
jgi:hypothetical protein